jgi:hypothetical protein
MTKTSILLRSTFILLLAMMFSLTSCDQDSGDLTSTDNFTLAQNLENLPMGKGEIMANKHFHPKHARGCLDLVFPVTIVFPDGTSAEVNDNEELRSEVRSWYENNTSDQRPSFEFPITVLIEDVETSIEDEDALIAALRDCVVQSGHGHSVFPFKLGDCIEVNYPITVLFPDGTSLEVADADELKAAFRAWHDSGADSLGRPTIQFPITITIRDRVLTINSFEQLKRASRLCRDRPTDVQRCFKIVYPVSLELPNGVIVEVGSLRAQLQVIKRWKTTHPDSDERPVLVFPIEVIFRDGSTQTVDSAGELQALKEACD